MSTSCPVRRQPGEIFVRMAKEGSTISGLMDSFATAISLALQHGVPLRLLVDKFSRTRFEPSGFTGNPEIPRASSLMDYLFRWLEAKFLRDEMSGPLGGSGEGTELTGDRKLETAPAARAALTGVAAAVAALEVIEVDARSTVTAKAHGTNGNGHKNGNGNGHKNGNGNGHTMYSFIARTDAPTCPECGDIMIPNGSCHKCVTCGTTSGCS